MNDQLLRTFIALVAFDQKILSLHNELKMLIDLRSALDDKKTLLIKGIETIMKQVHDLKKDVDEKELAMKVLDQQETEKKVRLENASTSKEYSSLKAEAAAINEKQHAHEPALIDAWDKLDASQKKYVSAKDNFNKDTENLERNTQEIDQKIEAITKLISEHEKERVTFVSVVQAELLDNYEHMRGQITNPVVTVLNNSCSACYYPVPAQDLSALRKGKLLPCKGCYRILYIEDSGQ